MIAPPPQERNNKRRRGVTSQRKMRSLCRLHLKSIVKGCTCLLILSILVVVVYEKRAIWEDHRKTLINAMQQRSGELVAGGPGKARFRGGIARSKAVSSDRELLKHQLKSPHNPVILPSQRKDVDKRKLDSVNSKELMELLGKKTPLKDTNSPLNTLLKSMSHRFPRIMIVGFGKTGTRALFDTLKMHPKLKGPTSEKRFFSDHFDRGLGSYLKSLPDPPKGGMVIEKSPDYIIDYPAPSRIRSSAEKVGIDPSKLKFIVMLRDPIYRAVSEYIEWQIARQSSHKQKLPPFDVMVMHSNGSINENQPFVIASNYQKHIKHWFEFFSKNQTCFVDGDKFVKDPYSEIHLLEQCLGLPTHFKSKQFVFDPKKGFYCFKWSAEQKEAHCMNSSKGRKHPAISSTVLELLKKYYKPFDDQLYPLTGRPMLWQLLNG